VMLSYIKHEARNCMYGKRCGGLPSRNFGGLARRGRSRYHSSRRHRLGAHGVRRSDLVTRQSPLRMKCGTARFWYWARVNVGPYTIIASYITSLTTMPKYPLNRITSRSTARPASQWRMSRATYHDADTSIVVSFERQKTILQAILTDRAALLKRIIAQLIGFDGAYHRFTGKVTVEKFEGACAWSVSKIMPSGN
jgi:hypothetical protein